MKPGDTIKRKSPWGDEIIKTLHNIDDVRAHEKMHKEGFDIDVLKNGHWEPLPRVVIHRAPKEDCTSCEA